MDNIEDAFRRAIDSIQDNRVYKSWIAENNDRQSGLESQVCDSTRLIPGPMCDEFYEAVGHVYVELGEFGEWVKTILSASSNGGLSGAPNDRIGDCLGQIGALIICRRHCVSVLSPGLSHAINCLSEACVEWNYSLLGDPPLETSGGWIDSELADFGAPSQFEEETEHRLIAVVEGSSGTAADPFVRELSRYYGLHKDFHATVDSFVRQDFGQPTILGQALTDLGRLAHSVALMDVIGATLRITISCL